MKSRITGVVNFISNYTILMLSNIEPFDGIIVDKDDLLFVPGVSGAQIVSGEFRRYDTKLYDWLRSNHENGVKICSVCQSEVS